MHCAPYSTTRKRPGIANAAYATDMRPEGPLSEDDDWRLLPADA